MRVKAIFVNAILLMAGLTITAAAQSEAGGGGRTERTGNSSDTTYKPRARATVKRTVPKHIVPKKTAGEYEAEGNTFYDQKDYDSAVVAYENAVKLKPSYQAFYRIGWIYNDFSEYAKALPALDRAIAINSSQSAPFTEKGYALRRLKRTDEAIDAFNRSVSLNSQEYVAPYELGSIYEERKMYPEAEIYLKQSIAIKSDDADYYTELGIVQRHLGHNQDAINSLNRAIQLDGENGRAYMGLGDVYYYGTSNYEKAAEAYVKGLQYDTDNQVAAFNIGYAYNDIGKYSEALEYLGKANKLKPNDYDTYVETGFALRKLKNEPQALAAYQKALQLKPNGSSATFGIGDIYFEIDKKYEMAADYYRRGLAISPDNAWALYRLGFCHNDAGRYGEAIEVLSKARSLKPDWVIVMNELGYSYNQLKRYDDAMSVLRKAVSADRNSEFAHYYLGQSYVLTRNRSAAMNEYRELQRLNSQYAPKLMDMINQM